jgi:hypothetical protein
MQSLKKEFPFITITKCIIVGGSFVRKEKAMFVGRAR